MAIVTYVDYLSFVDETELDNEAQIRAAIDAAEDYANRYCKRTFAIYDDTDAETIALTTLTETFSGNGRRKFWPAEAPIQSVTSISYWDEGTEAFVEFDSTVYTPSVWKESRVTFREGYMFPRGSDNLQIVYVYGFDAVPRGLVRAICLIAQAYAKTVSTDQTIKSQSDGEQTFTYYQNAKTDAPEEAKTLLGQFVRVGSVKT